jgi:hypothetical protein
MNPMMRNKILHQLAAGLPPLEWKKSKNFLVRTTEMSLGLQYTIQISLSGGVIWSVNTVKGCHNAIDPVDAEKAINKHHIDAIIGAFNRVPK